VFAEAYAFQPLRLQKVFALKHEQAQPLKIQLCLAATLSQFTAVSTRDQSFPAWYQLPQIIERFAECVASRLCFVLSLPRWFPDC